MMVCCSGVIPMKNSSGRGAGLDGILNDADLVQPNIDPDHAARNAATMNASATRGVAHVRDNHDHCDPQYDPDATPLIVGGQGRPDYYGYRPTAEETARCMDRSIGNVLAWAFIMAVVVILILGGAWFSFGGAR